MHQWKSRLGAANLPNKCVRSTNLLAIKFRLSPSRCQVPYTPSNFAFNSSVRCCSRRAFQTMTCTEPSSSSSDTKTTPFAVSGCCLTVTMPHVFTKRPSGRSRSSPDDKKRFALKPARSSAIGCRRPLRAECGLSKAKWHFTLSTQSERRPVLIRCRKAAVHRLRRIGGL